MCCSLDYTHESLLSRNLIQCQSAHLVCFRHVVAHAGGRSSVECVVIDDLLISVSSNSRHEPAKIARRVYTLAFLEAMTHSGP